MSQARSLASHAITAAAVPAATETVIATLTGISTVTADTRINLKAWVAVTTGTLVTAIQARIRRDSLTGTLVSDSGDVTAGVAASAPTSLSIAGDDSIPPSGNRTYVVTLETTGAGTDNTVTAVELTADYTP